MYATLVREQSCCRVADLYSYIGWGWCWWIKNHLTLKIWWLLECSFCHCWHSFIWFVTDDIRHRKTTPKLWPSDEVVILSTNLTRSTPCGRLFLFYSQYSILDTIIQGKSGGSPACILPAIHKICSIIRRADKWSIGKILWKMSVFTAFPVIVC